MELLSNLEKSLRPGATVVILDEDPDVTADDHFLTSAEIRKIFGDAGYTFIRSEDFLERDPVLVFRAPQSRLRD